ncbi:MAG: hypothetical protein KGI10_07840 [Thaumarchaeota archaeon]|nr:hypothetical protein [Nitrososphaerota archaeon]
MSHSAEYKENLSDIANILEEYSKMFERLDNITTDEDMKIIYGSLRTMNYYLGRSYIVSVNLLKEINVLFNAIEKLPRKAEYEEIKNMVEKQRESIVNTLIPIKEAFERSAEYENFGRKKMNDENGK